jgi:hypothetical protein
VTHRVARHRRHRPRGYVLPAAMLFLAIAFGMWAILHRSAATAIRFEQARVLRHGRNAFAAPAIAAGLRLLETGDPPGDPYACKLPITVDDQTRYFRLTYEQVSSGRWTVHAMPTTVDDAADDAPASF